MIRRRGARMAALLAAAALASGFWTPNRPTGTAVSIGACPHRATDSLRVRTDEI